MGKQYNNQIEELLPRYYDGDITDDERRMVEEWINASDENEKVARQILSIYLAADAVTVLQHTNTEKALKKVKGKMTAKKQRIWWNWVQRVAAVLFIPLLVAFLIQQFTSVPQSEQTAQWVQIKTNPGMTTSVILPDSTVVYLNSESSLSYPSFFNGDNREVYLKGEAYFEVAKDLKKRFMVSSIHDARVEVLGTHFNIEAYEDNEEIITTLVEGKVNFLFKQHQQTQKVALKPGEKLKYNAKKEEVQLYATSCESEISWKDDKIVLKDTPLREALRMLEKRYNVEFLIKNKTGLDDSFTGTFTNERIERILDHFKISSKIRWRYLQNADITEKKIQIEIY